MWNISHRLSINSVFGCSFLL
jgi:hypothetical protein